MNIPLRLRADLEGYECKELAVSIFVDHESIPGEKRSHEGKNERSENVGVTGSPSVSQHDGRRKHRAEGSQSKFGDSVGSKIRAGRYYEFQHR